MAFAISARSKLVRASLGSMIKARIEIDGYMIGLMMKAFQYSGDILNGLYYFEKLHTLGLDRDVIHHSIVIDTIARSGNITKAIELINSKEFMILGDSYRVGCLTSILHHAVRYNEFISSEAVGESIRQINPNCDAYYMELRKLYAQNGHWEKYNTLVKKWGSQEESLSEEEEEGLGGTFEDDEGPEAIRKMEGPELKREAGKSSISIQMDVHIFVAGDKDHPQIEEIKQVVEKLHKVITFD